MIDWFSGYIGYDATQLVLGRFVELEPDGIVVRDRDRWETARGSFSEGVQITRSSPTDQMIEDADKFGFLCNPNAVLRVSGNPSKFLQGHNVAGPSVALLGPVVQALVRAFGDGFRPGDADSELLPALQRSRVDITTSVDLGSHDAVHQWLLDAESMTRSRHGRAMATRGTVYWGKNSRRWSLKAYCKHCELKAHPPKNVELKSDLLEWTRPQLRIELTLRRPELIDRGQLDESIIWEFMRRIEMPDIKAHPELQTQKLSPNVRAALQLWLNGDDVASIYPHRTYYRHRKTILDAVGVDISQSAAAQIKAEPNALLGVEELQRREVIQIPDRIQRSLFGAG
jgi:hypothetical protein